MCVCVCVCCAAKRYTNPPLCSSRPRQKTCAHLTCREFYKSILGRKLQNDSRDVRLTRAWLTKIISRSVTAVSLCKSTITYKRERDCQLSSSYFSIIFNERSYREGKRISSTRVVYRLTREFCSFHVET